MPTVLTPTSEVRFVTTTPSGSDARRLVFAAALVCAGYYLAAQLGLMLRVWSTTPSVMWPPNALLTATLLLTPPRRWPLFLAAAAPAHFLVEASTGWPFPLIAALFLTNCSEAVIGAGGVWLFGRSPGRLDNLGALLIFLASVVVVGPIVSSFLDAAAVTWLHGESYWAVWRVRCLSNMLTELTVAPAVVGVVAHVMDGRGASLRRYAEAGLLTLGLVAAGAGSSRGGRQLLPCARSDRTCRSPYSCRSCSGRRCASGPPASAARSC